MIDNIFAQDPAPEGTSCGGWTTAGAAGQADEQFRELLARPGLRIERIVSSGQCSPPGFWYDQPDGEWVLLLEGAARLQFADEAAARDLAPGDFIDIAPHRRHRVEWTQPGQPTIWLAIHYAAPSAAPDVSPEPPPP